MARIALTLPDIYAYSTELTVRIQDINYGSHVGNDAFVSLLHEARIRYFNHLGYSETDIEAVPSLFLIWQWFTKPRHGMETVSKSKWPLKNSTNTAATSFTG